MRTRRLAVLVALVPGLMVMSAAPAHACEPLPDPSFEQAVANDGVVGVVERETLASNPLPWGTSVSVVTRIWGGIRADRWKVSNMGFNDCPDDPVRSPGSFEYDFRGAEAEWDGVQSHIGSPLELPENDLALVVAEFGPSEAFTVGGVDRFMAHVRVFGFELTVAIAVLIVAIVALIRRRIRKRYDRTLF
ncbi:MAG: hypothetical protein ACFCVC_05255 [Acidimicrobiia bacterium]